MPLQLHLQLQQRAQSRHALAPAFRVVLAVAIFRRARTQAPASNRVRALQQRRRILTLKRIRLTRPPIGESFCKHFGYFAVCLLIFVGCVASSLIVNVSLNIVKSSCLLALVVLLAGAQWPPICRAVPSTRLLPPLLQALPPRVARQSSARRGLRLTPRCRAMHDRAFVCKSHRLLLLLLQLAARVANRRQTLVARMQLLQTEQREQGADGCNSAPLRRSRLPCANSGHRNDTMSIRALVNNDRNPLHDSSSPFLSSSLRFL